MDRARSRRAKVGQGCTYEGGKIPPILKSLGVYETDKLFSPVIAQTQKKCVFFFRPNLTCILQISSVNYTNKYKHSNW